MTDDAMRVCVRGVGHSYDGTHWQFRDLDFTLDAGTVLAILGANGRGKSTLLRVLAGLRYPSCGEVRMHGNIGWVPQDFSRSLPYRVLDIVLMGRARQIGLLRMPRGADHQAADAALATTGTAHLATRTFDSLSGGERQLVLIARAIASQPAVLLLDEPAAALDLCNQDRVLSLIQRLARAGLCIVFTTHQPNHALAVADHALLMQPDGSILYGAAPATLTAETLSALYGLSVRMLPLGSGERHAAVPLYATLTE